MYMGPNDARSGSIRAPDAVLSATGSTSSARLASTPSSRGSHTNLRPFFFMKLATTPSFSCSAKAQVQYKMTPFGFTNVAAHERMSTCLSALDFTTPDAQCAKAAFPWWAKCLSELHGASTRIRSNKPKRVNAGGAGPALAVASTLVITTPPPGAIISFGTQEETTRCNRWTRLLEASLHTRRPAVVAAPSAGVGSAVSGAPWRASCAEANNMDASTTDLPPGAAHRSSTEWPGSTPKQAAAITEAPSRKYNGKVESSTSSPDGATPPAGSAGTWPPGSALEEQAGALMPSSPSLAQASPSTFSCAIGIVGCGRNPCCSRTLACASGGKKGLRKATWLTLLLNAL
mmetsp:Transcript_37591/g.108067  ORF Transcript_37591/g.108067 Transcript_37591/m.108067 type:complete len:345 (+) Transcript_37591:78-1112(+)